LFAQVRGKSVLAKWAGNSAGEQSHQRRGESRGVFTTREALHLFRFPYLDSYCFCFGDSDGENVPESVPAVRTSRRAKTAALEKTKLDLNTLINQEANVS